MPRWVVDSVPPALPRSDGSGHSPVSSRVVKGTRFPVRIWMSINLPVVPDFKRGNYVINW